MNHKCGTAKQRNLNANDIKERGNMEVKGEHKGGEIKDNDDVSRKKGL